MKMEHKTRKERLSKSAATGAVALIFMIIGFQAAIFFVKVIESPAELPVRDTILDNAPHGDRGQYFGANSDPSASEEYLNYSSGDSLSNAIVGDSRSNNYGGNTRSGSYAGSSSAYYGGQRSSYGRFNVRDSLSSQRFRRPAVGSPYKPFRREERKVESFPFNPNTVTVEELQRLGLSQKQAEVIERFRASGGKFREKEDFRKMYVVSDALYQRLEPFIDIPKVELNSADTTVLMTLKGIGPYYARRIIEYRDRLGGFFDIGQLLEVKGFDQERFDALAESVKVDTSLIRPFGLWCLPQDSVGLHPYIGSYAAKGIVRYRQVCDSSQWSVAALASNGIISQDVASRLVHYVK